MGSRPTQPYRPQGGRPPGMALEMMLRGAPAFLANPMDLKRRTQKGVGLAQLMLRP